ncbi:hypothetical protein LCGC14_0392610 [marine sediment metagenome]|uniref:Uncharacterized protein n=1 Tax=marine sediment metagenome TaxID=412755 RepID=A0A0F9SYY2_9ZZZZ
MTDLTRSTSKDNKFHLGQYELAGMIRPAIRSYRFHNNNQNPEAIIIPFVKEVDGIRIEYGKSDPLQVEIAAEAKMDAQDMANEQIIEEQEEEPACPPHWYNDEGLCKVCGASAEDEE